VDLNPGDRPGVQLSAIVSDQASAVLGLSAELALAINVIPAEEFQRATRR
jgi:hypothetical protein